MADNELWKYALMPQGRLMQIRTLALAIAAVVALSACGSSKNASKQNFAKAIDAHYATNCTALDFSMGTRLFAKFSEGGGFPASVADGVEAGHPEKHTGAPFEALEKVGLLTSKTTEVQAGLFGAKVAGKEYSLTEAGTKALLKPGRASFCVGHRKVDEVVQFSEPSSGMGQTVSQAKYTYTVVDVPAWASDPALQDAFPELAEVLEPKKEAHVDLVLMNDGWDAQPSAF
jgi:hypothetical protein